ncbi:MAG: D-glycerate dehydrogenase [Bacteroidota bacterium]|nr:D-glycerate dehydrogenase [Bacteroidota bacterium]
MEQKPKIYITRRIPDAGLKSLNDEFEVRMNEEDRMLSKQEIIANMNGCDILLSMLTDNIDAEVINSNKNLKGISNYAAGYNNIDIAEATKRDVFVTNTPGVLTDTTADLAWALLMSVSRKIVEGDKFTRQGKFEGWAPMLMLGGDIHHKTLGIIGSGRIGSAMAKRASGFDMKILYFSRSENKELEKNFNAKRVSKEELLKESDFVSLHVSLSSETHYFIDEKELRMMKDTAYLINTARGSVVNEKMLVKALKQNWIAGAGLDVFENEPELHSGLTDLHNVVIAPHVGSASLDTRSTMAKIAANNAIALQNNKKSQYIVNPEV